jgi:hypothetical protein
MGKLKEPEDLKVYCVGSNRDGEWLTCQKGFVTTNMYDDSNIVVFPGGSDWSPVLYNEQVGKQTYCYENIDKVQLRVALNCIKDKKFIVGICRGAQMLCILAGGKLIQHVDGHSGRIHDIYTFDKQMLQTNSIHHQMADVYSIPDMNSYQILAEASLISTTYLRGDDQEAIFAGTSAKYIDHLPEEPEIVMYNLIGGLGIQGHPEMDSMPLNTIDFITSQIVINYAKFKRKHIILPEFIETRLTHIQDNFLTKSKTNHVYTTKETNWDTMPQNGRWEY